MAGTKKPAVETLSHPGGGWGNKIQGNERFSNTAPTKAQAQQTGRQMAIDRKTEHIIKN